MSSKLVKMKSTKRNVHRTYLHPVYNVSPFKLADGQLWPIVNNRKRPQHLLRALESVVCEVLQRGFHLQGVLADGLRVNG